MFLRDGVPIPEASQTGPLASGVPGALAAYELALARCGTKQLDRLLAPGIDAAANGFVIDGRYARSLQGTADDLRRFDGSRGVLLRPDGEPWAEGERLLQADLANTYRQIAEHGSGWFYRGEFAEKVADWMAAHGGILTVADFAGYQAKLREPIESSYRGYRVIGFPPPSSGGVHVAQVLNTLEQFDLKTIHDEDPAAAAHLVVEAFKLAFADRAHWLGDADFVDVPRGLLAKEYAVELAAKIDRRRATEVPQHGTPPNWQQDLMGRHTTHVAAADAEGNWVAITATVNTAFGSKVIVPGTGVVLNNQMDDFSIAPGVPNAFKLIGAENNAIAPGKRPLSSMSPTIVLDRAGRPVLTVGAAGGPKIISQVVLAIVRTLDLGESLEQAVAGARFHHQWRPDLVYHERALDPAVARAMEARGHVLEALAAGGVTQAIAARREGGFIGVADPRVSGTAAGQ
jgi:gamma-glutamyltranspeptidase/glutathione hydrolase